MNWRLKCFCYKVLSALPGGKGLYGFVQRYLTGSIIPSKSRVEQKLEVAIRYWTWISAHGFAENLVNGVHLDFGAGWHPTIPLMFYSLGVGQQRLLDLKPVKRFAAVKRTKEIFREVAPSMAEKAGIKLLRLPPVLGSHQTLDQLFDSLGIHYEAPYRDLMSQPGDCVDLVTSTQVLLHIDEPALRECFRAIFHVLKPGGHLLATIHLRSLYGGLLKGKEAYQYLRYSPKDWEAFGSSIMSYSRLKAPDYRRLLLEVGFELSTFEVDPIRPEDLEVLSKVPVHSCFASYTKEELAARHLFFAARKPL